MWLRKAQAGSAPGHTWHEDGAIVEVLDELGHELLALVGGGFSRAEASAIPEPPAAPPAVEPPAAPAPPSDSQPELPAAETAAPAVDEAAAGAETEPNGDGTAEEPTGEPTDIDAAEPAKKKGRPAKATTTAAAAFGPPPEGATPVAE